LEIRYAAWADRPIPNRADRRLDMVRFHYLINPKRLCPGRWWASIAAILGGGMILALAKSIEIYGLILFFQSRDWSYYLPFFITSAVVLIVLIPTLLLRVPKPDIGLSAKSK